MADRYDEQARELRGPCGTGELGSLCSREVPALARVLRSAAQEAQVRVLNEALRSCLRATYRVSTQKVAELRARIEKEGPL